MAFYHDQHLAWQQRVSKEVTAASRFLSQFQPVSKTSTHYVSKNSATPNSNTLKQFYKTADSKMSGVYAEVRGKYARPPPLMQKSTQYDILAPKENTLVGRPSTSGSLKPRSASAYSQVKKPEVKESSPVKNRIFKYRTASSHSKQDEKSPTLPEKLRRQVEEKPEDLVLEDNENIEDGEEDLDKVEDLPPKEADIQSNMSGITTSSQRRYIQELEAMLRDEKLKRMQIEDTLQKILDNQT